MMMPRGRGTTNEAYEAYIRKKAKKMTIEEILKFRNASVYKRNWLFISILFPAIISPLFLITFAIVSNPESNAPNMEDFFPIILLFITLPLILIALIYSLKQDQKIQDKVIDEMLNKKS